MPAADSVRESIAPVVAADILAADVYKVYKIRAYAPDQFVREHVQRVQIMGCQFFCVTKPRPLHLVLLSAVRPCGAQLHESSAQQRNFPFAAVSPNG